RRYGPERHAGRLLLFRQGGRRGAAGALGVAGALSHQCPRLSDYHRADGASPDRRRSPVRSGGDGSADRPERRGPHEHLCLDGTYRRPVPIDGVAQSVRIMALNVDFLTPFSQRGLMVALLRGAIASWSSIGEEKGGRESF